MLNTFVDCLQHAGDLALEVVNRFDEHGFGVVAGQLIKTRIKPAVLIAIRNIHGFSRLENVARNAL